MFNSPIPVPANYVVQVVDKKTKQLVGEHFYVTHDAVMTRCAIERDKNRRVDLFIIDKTRTDDGEVEVSGLEGQERAAETTEGFGIPTT